MLGIVKEFTKGIVILNPIFIMALGLCPALAVTNTMDKALAMSAAFAIVIVVSSLTISLIRKLIPSSIRIPIIFMIIATFVTIVEMLFQAYYPVIHISLGIYVSLLAVNCIISGRAKTFASRNNFRYSLADSLGMSVGFLIALVIISFFRELLSTGGIKIFGNALFTLPVLGDQPIHIFGLSAGALLSIGLLVAFFKWIGVIKDV